MLLTLLTLLLPASLPVQDPSPAPRAAPILDAMGELESARDAKCHSTACRFENYVFGTPLTDEARERRSALQKELVAQVWAAASTGSDPVVGGAAVEEALGAVLTVKEGLLGDLAVTFPAGPREEPVRISQLRRRQYGSIAYAYRALLAVQQDEEVLRATGLRELSEEAVLLLKDGVDLVTLCALSIADEAARAASRAELDGAAFESAWRTLVPAPTAPLQRAEADADRAYEVLRGLIEEKVAAYEVYNVLDAEAAARRFAVNVERFYALYQMSPDREQARAFLATFENAVVSFTLQLLIESASEARSRGHALVRSEDALAAVQKLTPHEVDTLEDVHFFGHLPPGQRVTLEAYDCDSFRDLGFHWGYIERAIDRPERPDLAPDPFAAEILAESVSQFSVLVLRMAGDVARNKAASPALRDADLQRAVQRIVKRAREHHERPAPVLEATTIRSAKTRTKRTDGVRFVDVTTEAGLDYVHRSSSWLSEFRRTRTSGPPTFSGGGVAAEDVDGDGDVDVFLCGGLGNGLYLNDGSGAFSRSPLVLDAFDEEGATLEARTPLLLDFDNDGRLDLLVTYAGSDHKLWRNVTPEGGALAFEDVSERAGLGGADRIDGPVTAFDYDGDGLLDVYLAAFGDYRAGALPTVDRDNKNGGMNRLLRNLGELRFEDVSKGSGAADTGWCQAVSHTDLDGDGRQDLVVANDFGRNALLLNRGDGTFENASTRLGMTNSFHSMNVGVTDLNDDGHPDVYISNIATLAKDNKYVLPDVLTPVDFNYDAMATMLVKESDVLYLSRLEDGRLSSFEEARSIERGTTSTGWAWDAEFLDFDHDGDDDLYVVNGTNDYNFYASVHRAKTGDGEVVHQFLSHARESNVLFENDAGKLRNVSEGSGADLLLNSRSTAYFDADGDGDLDVALNNFHAAAVLLENRAPAPDTNWLAVRLVGDPSQGSNRDAIGAKVIARTSGGVRATRELQGGSGYLSMNARRIHFGLGAAESADLTIRWPNGEVQEVEDLASGRLHTIRQ